MSRSLLFLLLIAFSAGCELDTGELPEGTLGDPEVCVDGPGVGSCLANLWGDCSSPSGACQLGALTNGAAFLWASGHGVGFTAQAGEGSPVLIAGVGASGESCFTGTRTLDPVSNTATTVWQPASGGPVTVVEAGDGRGSVTCADASELVLDELEPLVWSHCLQAGLEGGVCDFAGLGSLYAAQTAPAASGSCGANQACPPGSQCCPGGGGSPYCSAVCL